MKRNPLDTVQAYIQQADRDTLQRLRTKVQHDAKIGREDRETIFGWIDQRVALLTPMPSGPRTPTAKQRRIKEHIHNTVQRASGSPIV